MHVDSHSSQFYWKLNEGFVVEAGTFALQTAEVLKCQALIDYCLITDP